MQSDANVVIGRWRPQRIRDNTGRPRFCFLQDDYFDCGRPLADRVYHCSYVAKKCDKDGQLRGIHIPVYDHYCHWIGVIVYLDTVKPYLLTTSFLFMDAMIVFSCSIVDWFLFQYAVLPAPVMVLTAIIVVWLASQNAWLQFKRLAMRNITFPERNF